MLYDETYESSCCVVKVSKFPDDAESLINVVKSLPGVRDKPVRGKYQIIIIT